MAVVKLYFLELYNGKKLYFHWLSCAKNSLSFKSLFQDSNSESKLYRTYTFVVPSYSDFFAFSFVSVPNLISNGMSVVYTVVLVLFFRADYKRMWAEDRIKAADTLQGNVNGGDSV